MSQPYKHLTFFLLIVFFISFSQDMCSRSAVTYKQNGGRLGDQLLAYSKAKWIAYHYGLDLLYKPFEYSDCFMLDELEKEQYTPEHEKEFKNKKRLKKARF